jgi:hypothetical protein
MRRVWLLLSWLLMPTAAMAQVRSETTGLRLNAHLNGSAISFEDLDERDSGAGVGLSVGYGVTPNWLVFATVDAASIDVPGFSGYTLGHVDLGVRYSFASADRRLVPFLAAAYTYRLAIEVIENEDFTLSGSGGTIGGGAAFYFSPSLALEGELGVNLGWFTDAKIGDMSLDLDETLRATSTRLNLGLSWYPRGSRAPLARR